VPDVQIMPMQFLPRNDNEAYFYRKVQRLWPRRHRSRLERGALRYSVSCLRKWRDSYREDETNAVADRPGNCETSP
jgi:hypothetical protein